MPESNKSIIISCAVLALAVTLYSLARTHPFAQQDSCATHQDYLFLMGKTYVLTGQIEACRQLSGEGIKEFTEHFTKRMDECKSLSEKLGD